MELQMKITDNLSVNTSFDEIFTKALNLRIQRNYHEAREAWKIALKMHPSNPDSLINLGNVEDDLMNYDSALDFYSKAIMLSPNYAIAYNNRGYTHRKKGNFLLAISDLSKAISLNYPDPFCYYMRGSCYGKLGKHDKALSDYNKAITLKYHEFNFNKISAIVSKNKIKKIDKIIKKLLYTGFYLNSYEHINEKVFISPRIFDDRIILWLNNLHIGKTMRKHLRQHESRYELKLTSDFGTILDRCRYYYNDLLDLDYLTRLHFIFSNSPYTVAVSLYKDGRLVAGEIGFLIGKVYSSYTGYHEHTESSSGTAQIILLANELVKMGVLIYDMGPSTLRFDNYKLNLGCIKIQENEYIRLFNFINPSSESIIKKRKQTAKISINPYILGQNN